MKEEFIELLNKYHEGKIETLNIAAYIHCVVGDEIAEGEVDTDEIVEFIDFLVANYLDVCEELKTYKSEFM